MKGAFVPFESPMTAEQYLRLEQLRAARVRRLRRRQQERETARDENPPQQLASHYAALPERSFTGIR